jgi:NDP-sugar pyrophosphorylase family protein
MMEIEKYFSLKSFAHRDLWKKGAFPWEPLDQLINYLQSMTFHSESKISKHVHLEKPESIFVGKGTIIEAGVYIEGPCWIGSHCVIRNGAYLRGGVLCGNGCAIGHSAEVKHSILFDHAAVTHFTYVGDSIIGTEVNLGAGVKCANLRLDRREILVEFQGKKVKTGLKKLGAIVGDRAQIGCNCVLNPGTLVGKGSVVYPLLNLGGTIPPSSCVVKDEERLKISPFQSSFFETIGASRVP